MLIIKVYETLPQIDFEIPILYEKGGHNMYREECLGCSFQTLDTANIKREHSYLNHFSSSLARGSYRLARSLPQSTKGWLIMLTV